MEKPTLSPQSNRILETCQGVLDGTVEPSELATLLDEVYEGLDKARNDFETEVEKQGEEYISKIQWEMELVLAAFEDYQDALDKISDYFNGYNPQNIEEGMEMLIRATNAILDTITVYESKSLQLGPTAFPILNMLILMVDSFKKGDIPQDEFRAYIWNCSEFFKKMIKEGEEYDGDKCQGPVQTLVGGYKKFIEGLEKLDEGAESNNELLLDDALEVIHESQQIIKKGYDDFNDEMYFEGPTVSPYANLLIATIKGHREGTFPKELLAKNLNAYIEHMADLRDEIQAVSQVELENKAIEAEIPRTLEAINTNDEACELVNQYLQDGNMAHLDPAIDKLKQATEMLKDSQKKYDDIAEKEGKVVCVRCQALNLPSNNVCSNCGAVLPKIAGMEGGSTFSVGEGGEFGIDGNEIVITETLKKLIDACAAARDGKISIEEFTAVLDAQEAGIYELEKDLDKPPISLNIEDYPEDQREIASEQIEMAREIIDLTHEGAEEYLEGLRVMRNFAVDGDIEHLRQGLELTVMAMQKLYQVQRFGEISKAKIAEFEAAQAAAEQQEGGQEGGQQTAPAGSYTDEISSIDSFEIGDKI